MRILALVAIIPVASCASAIFPRAIPLDEPKALTLLEDGLGQEVCLKGELMYKGHRSETAGFSIYDDGSQTISSIGYIDTDFSRMDAIALGLYEEKQTIMCGDLRLEDRAGTCNSISCSDLFLENAKLRP